MSKMTRRDAIRAAISDAYYKARNESRTMETAADEATKAVLALIPTVELVEELNKPTRCRVWVGGTLIFEGWDRSASIT